jgi:hypothetical protein
MPSLLYLSALIDPEIPHVDYVGFELMLERTSKILIALSQR